MSEESKESATSEDWREFYTSETKKAHDQLISDAVAGGATIEDFARAWASIDGKRDRFDACKNDSSIEENGGYYDGYVCETEEMFRRATKYAKDRSNSDGGF